MNRRDLVSFFLFEILCVFIALGSFRFIESRITAALVAGSGFLALGAWIVYRTWQWKDKWTALVFWVGHVHLWLISLPMVLIRLSRMGEEFHQIEIFGLSGPTFHRMSEKVFLILMVVTIVDYIRVVWRTKMKAPTAE